jgi:outer membrane receptor protein involved in Fe transport
VFVAICLSTPAWAGAQTPASSATGIVRGIVLDRTGGTPIADVSVRIQDREQRTTTDAAGRFELRDVPSGQRTLLVSIIGFIMVKRTVEVVGGQTTDVTVVLSEGTGTYSETVTVIADRFPEQERAVPAQQVLGSADIQNLRSLVTNDPLRTVQVLPGVSTGDDFRSEFAVRGSPFGKIVFTLDGVPAPFLLHTVQQVLDGGSIAMINGDILDRIALMNGSYPQRYGNRIGAELDFVMREGSRERWQIRAGVSGTDASFVAEGPIGSTRSGSWLVSVRKSYLEYLLKRVAEEGDDFGFGFYDLQAKLVKDLTARHRLEVSLVAGRSRLDQNVLFDDPDEVADGRNAAELVNLGWRFTPTDRLSITQRVAYATNRFNNDNLRGESLGSGGGSDLTWRADVTAGLSAALTLEGGVQVQRQERHADLLEDFDGTRFVLYDGRSTHTSTYAQAVWSPSPWLTVTPGVRADLWSLTSASASSPWLQADVKLSKSLTVRAGTGIYRQFPAIEVVTGFFGNPDLRPERAVHADLGIEQTFGSARWQVTVYRREEQDLLRRDLSEPRVDPDEPFPVGHPGTDGRPIWRNALDGTTHGVEFLIQRRSNAGVTGWVSYSYGVNRYTDQLTGESFDGDFDERHTVNMYLVFRLSNRTSLATKWRAGSNVPAVGYFEQQGNRFFLDTDRNRLRVPAYSRLDVRLSRAFNFQTRRLTLFVEVLNLLGRENLRASRPGVNPFTREVFGLFQTMIPRLPSAGLLIEF